MRRRLIVLCPGLGQGFENWHSLTERLFKEKGLSPNEADWLPFDHRITCRSSGRLYAFAFRLCAAIHEQWTKVGGYEDIVLIGHSIGGLLVRQAYLLAAGADSRKPGSDPWSGTVSRIILFAGINRGVDTENPWHRRFLAWLVRVVPHPHFVIEDGFRGSDFISNLRINWIRHFSNLSRTPGGHSIPAVVQLLGTEDGIVSNEDSKDVLAFPNSHPVFIANAGHGDLYRLDLATDPDGRYRVILNAIEQAPALAIEPAIETPKDKIDRILFILHGIKSSTVADWFKRLEGRARAKGYEVIPPEYGYMSPANFAAPSVRKRYVRWFQDRYTEVLSAHPTAEFDFVGHSNGTYMLGQSLARLPGMKFRNVALAGSVLPTEYDWDARILNGQVERIRNDCAARDVPVGLLCSALNGLFMRDIGTGGFEGFKGLKVKQVAYYPGGHGSVLGNETVREHLLDFAMGGTIQTEPTLLQGPGFFRQLSRSMPFLTWGLLCVGLYYLLRPEAGLLKNGFSLATIHIFVFSVAKRVFVVGAVLALIYVILNIT